MLFRSQPLGRNPGRGKRKGGCGVGKRTKPVSTLTSQHDRFKSVKSASDNVEVTPTSESKQGLVPGLYHHRQGVQPVLGLGLSLGGVVGIGTNPATP